ncbi:uncharacterized protein LOC128215069 [Mya arenaria]|uniref:uncharacterized protein LOC128215069 n=1 Tax=Mya arenaria TaxID=6604 RepID=UPI0022E0D89A|nr:uncharacterized protein LOC128215069 [Mya arenaria]
MAGTVLFLIAAALAAACGAVRVILPPTDMARVVGSNVTLACVVSDRQPLESVQWKHQPVNSDAINALTFNENVLSSHAKYSVVWTYNLTVANLTHADTGLYRCTAGGRDHDAILTVVGMVGSL